MDSRKKPLRDLSGVDSIGSLMIVKIVRGDAEDPFEDFVRYVKSASMKRKWTAATIRAMLKYSAKNSFTQDAIKRLQLAYCASFAPLLCNDFNLRSIERALDTREAVGNPFPVFVGVVASTDTSFRLSQKALKNFELLQSHVGSERLLLRVISARLTPGRLRIECRTPERAEVARVVTSAVL
jgi:hypothetical protein